jgi:hypothetical protein
MEVGAMAWISVMHKRWMKEGEYRSACDALEEEFTLAKAVRKPASRRLDASRIGPKDGDDAAHGCSA